MTFVSARSYGDEVSDRATPGKNRQGDLGISVRNVPVLKHGALEGISVKGTCGALVVHDETASQSSHQLQHDSCYRGKQQTKCDGVHPSSIKTGAQQEL